MKKSDTPNCINLYYRQFVIGQIDTEKKVRTFKKAYPMIRERERGRFAASAFQTAVGLRPPSV